MGDKNIAKNYIYNLIYQVLVIILPLITTPYVSRILGAENIGIYSYTLSIVTYFVLIGSLGVATYGQRETAYVQSDKKKRSAIFWEIIIFRIITMALVSIVYYFMYIRGTQYTLYYKILILELISNCLDISWFFQGMEEFKKTVTRNTIVKVLSIICIFSLVKTANDLGVYILIYALSNLIGNISLWAYLPKYIQKINLKEIKLRRHLKPVIALFIPQIAIQLYTVLDKVMIGSIVENKVESGYYEQAQKIIKILLTIVTALGTVMLPRIANKFADGKTDEIKRNIKTSFKFTYLLAFPIMFGIIAISNRFVPVFLGAGYEEVSLLIRIISPIILMIGLSNVIGNQYLLPTKRQKSYTISVLCGAITNLILNFILIKRYEAVGASIATVIAETTVVIIQFICVRNEIKFLEIIKLGLKNLIASIIMLVIAILIEKILQNKSSYIIILIQVCSGVIVYFAMLLILKDKFIMEIKDKLIKKRKTIKI